MHVEESCQALLHYVLPKIDRSRKGLCIDVGVGTFALYCEIFARTGFDTVAVEPLPTPAITKTCHSRGITLIKSCVYDNDGTQTMYKGAYNDSENLNLSSIRSDWWGSSSNSVQVRSMTLDTLLKSINAHFITCLKLDVEGVESVIIKQLHQVHASLLPAVVVFEYGGGSSRLDGKAGWSETGINETLSCFNMLKDLGYRTTILVDSMQDSTERVIDMAEVNVLPDILFHPRSVYGNAICFRDRVSDSTWIEHICSLYRDNNIQPPKLLPETGRLALFAWRLRRAVRRFCK
jgi:FkbM family methyltransferase